MKGLVGQPVKQKRERCYSHYLTKSNGLLRCRNLYGHNGDHKFWNPYGFLHWDDEKKVVYLSFTTGF